MRLRRSNRFAWGGSAWTLPIPTKPRIYGDFTYFQPYVWLLTDSFNARGHTQMLMLRVHDDPRWAEADRYDGALSA